MKTASLFKNILGLYISQPLRWQNHAGVAKDSRSPRYHYRVSDTIKPDRGLSSHKWQELFRSHQKEDILPRSVSGL